MEEIQEFLEKYLSEHPNKDIAFIDLQVIFETGKLEGFKNAGDILNK